MKIKELRNYIFLAISIVFFAVFFAISTSHAQIMMSPKAPSIMRPYISVGIATNPFHSLVRINGKTITPNSSGMSVPISIGIETVNPISKLLVRTEIEITPTTYSETALSSRTMYYQAGTTLLTNLHLGAQWKYGSIYGIFGAGIALNDKILDGTIQRRTNFAFNIGLGGGVKMSKNFGLDLAIAYQNLGGIDSQSGGIFTLESHIIHTIRPTLSLRYTF